MRPPPLARRGLSILELVVSVAIVGVVAALVVPGIQRVRVAAKRTQCANNMRQIAAAAQTHVASYGRLPVGIQMPYALKASPPSIADASGIPPPELLYDLTLTDSPARRNSDPIRYPFGPNWAVLLLPFLDQEQLYKAARPGDYLPGYQAAAASGTPLGLDTVLSNVPLLGSTASADAAKRDNWLVVLRDKVVPVYLCPADAGNAKPFSGYTQKPGPWARGNYAANAGPGWWQMSLNGRSYSEAFGKTGPVMAINFGAVPAEIRDGASQTAMFTEVRVGVSERDPRGVWTMGFPGASITAANAIGDCPAPNDRVETSDDVQGCPEFYYSGIGTRHRMGCNTGFANLGWPSWQAQTRSRHPGGVNVCLADGAVVFVRDSVHQGVWFRLLSSNDGAAVGPYTD
ncbi:Uncharacterized protein OS=Pirellula staleyi (strain ATCC 27377 / DSM 6068 / ICPB 4128) GN=Psta_3886 PE=4 SV=1: SBP_bac_10 [Gemmataceae bacterium]|nr:Uncharacterized protein OS=Pirellula staleyi (strain ATCC 27377 / DSM 6068 / ICPB 4128) GN=Psta_3886 PE=4 SV=1: SBP_bac_10 [Gemmataceae bacterium]VTU02183.1 Uncharacterized protein OS=Pirellula staleyi (strain ATCC 27377 / DSM 6068 / ICPB 4128) GN=Psta_3886 PE=4 SV=1: SBP_bac_10 [Gemmataceae bacterium]